MEQAVSEYRQAGLQTVSVYLNATFHEAAAAEKAAASILELAAAIQPLGVQAIVTNPMPKSWSAYQPKSDAELEVQAAALNRLGEALRKRGMALHLHHHNTEMAANAREWRHLLRNTGPRSCWFCIDIEWVHRGGQDPLAILREAGPRIGSLHLRNSRRGVWSEDFTDGDVDYRPVAAYLRSAGFGGLLTVELYYEKATVITRTREDNLRISRKYAERIFRIKA